MSSTDSEKGEKAPARSLSEVLEDTEKRALFGKFLAGRAAIESLVFYEHIEMYERISDSHYQQRAALHLLNKFILPGAQFCVNLSGEIKTDLLDAKEFTAESFDAAKREIVRLMETNFLTDFNKLLCGDDDLKSMPQLSNGMVYTAGEKHHVQALAKMREFLGRRGSRTASRSKANLQKLNSKLGTTDFEDSLVRIDVDPEDDV